MPFTFLAFLSPLIAVIYAVTNEFMWREGDRAAVKTYHNDATAAV
jgi:NhaC family Na+:H+ antiporter